MLQAMNMLGLTFLEPTSNHATSIALLIQWMSQHHCSKSKSIFIASSEERINQCMIHAIAGEHDDEINASPDNTFPCF